MYMPFNVVLVIVAFSLIALALIIGSFARYFKRWQNLPALKILPPKLEPHLRLLFDIVVIVILVFYSVFVVARVIRGQTHPITVYEVELHPEGYDFASPSMVLCPCNNKPGNALTDVRFSRGQRAEENTLPIPYFDIPAGGVNGNGVLTDGLGLNNSTTCYMSKFGAFQWTSELVWARVHIKANFVEYGPDSCAIFGILNHNKEKEKYLPNTTRLYAAHHIPLGEVHETFQWTEYNYEQLASTTRLYELVSSALIGERGKSVSLNVYPANVDVVHNRQINSVSLMEMLGAFSGLLSLLLAVRVKMWGNGEYRPTGAMQKYMFIDEQQESTETQPNPQQQT
eukprot:TRINITY_DN67259_c11_g1_i1.p1 TRINITY_DN67259_c11_g1~~TRINITY_DN67259_c11_g1_i1.p1  ORF type:complete len:340 (-),score=25.63 TRINITY_DN67259_c11_g1_i1:46-1065(-)